MKILGVVPARGGSKGVPNKNIKPLGNKPLLHWTIEAAQKSQLLTTLLVSTDSETIRRAVGALNVEVLDRPPSLASDDAPMAPVIQHAMAHAERSGTRYDAIFTLQPTTPFRHADDIDAAIQLMVEHQPDSVIGVVRVYDSHPARIKKIVGNRLLPFCVPEDESSRRQDLSPAYLRNGAVYLTRRDVLEKGSVRGTEQMPYEMPAERSINIDEPLDFALAEALLASQTPR